MLTVDYKLSGVLPPCRKGRLIRPERRKKKVSWYRSQRRRRERLGWKEWYMDWVETLNRLGWKLDHKSISPRRFDASGEQLKTLPYLRLRKGGSVLKLHLTTQTVGTQTDPSEIQELFDPADTLQEWNIVRGRRRDSTRGIMPLDGGIEATNICALCYPPVVIPYSVEFDGFLYKGKTGNRSCVGTEQKTNDLAYSNTSLPWLASQDGALNEIYQQYRAESLYHRSFYSRDKKLYSLLLKLKSGTFCR